MTEKITILHTNDLHSHLENWPKIRRYLINTREKLQNKDNYVLVFDLGDAMDRVHPLTEATDGKANIELMNTVNYDAVTIGNNEGIGNSHEQLSNLYRNANFPVVLDNIKNQDNGLIPSWVRISKIFKTSLGTKIGVVACTAPFPATYEMNRWYAEKVENVLPKLLADLKDKVDIIIMLSHLGIDVDRGLAKNFKEINVILGSHTHHLLVNGEVVENTLICAAGKWGQYVGRVDIECQDNELLKSSASVVDVAKLPEFNGDSREINNYQQKGEKMLDKKKVALLPKDYLGIQKEWSPLMQASLKAIEGDTGTKIAILNGGLFLGDLHKGIISKNDLHRILPHPMRVINVRLNGYNLWRLIREMEKNRNHLRNTNVKGNGFRGKVFGEIIYDGIKYDSLSKNVLIHERMIDPGADYEIATVDNFVYCPFFPTLEIAGHIDYLGDRFLRDIVGDYFGEKFPV
ncbi:bifunctional metallophosphatase/5'-nucleotidase [Liquorilactobacillus hordei]|uniref:Metallophosphoesterase n=1 Tax=Liquorilactobacillus hordei DSM 19519 TaxID=1423759 RepID=A0A0R1MBS8_9LACO|nr:bifunctional metallophosphatase/5'-nucleotidase [Liquorilactobacillus hordei]KRL05584.1 metallophosphoesterase [Liquorilactobacillus hordei DSM 19519]QYH52791.1 bifunctional metallophosphatase/5'-nucleotidase [Liquorilactobacillus hordei DSM 19519]